MVHSSSSAHKPSSLNEQDVMPVTLPARSVGRKATISKEELFHATLNLIGPQKSIASLSLREIAREAGIAPNSFYRHFKDIDELAIALIERAGMVLRQIIRQARLQASPKTQSIVRSSVEVFIQQLDTDEGYLSLLLREGYTGSPSYKAAVERQLIFFQQELHEDLIRIEQVNDRKISHANIAAKAITQLVFNMGAKVIDVSPEQRTQVADQTIIMIRMILEGARNLNKSSPRSY